jgi:hypothetical protein
MHRLLGALALLALLLVAGCGDETSSDAADTPTPSSTPSLPSPSGSPGKGGSPSDYQTVAILSQTAADGTVDLNAVRLDVPGERREFVAQFAGTGMDQKIADAIASAAVPSGYALMGAVVSIGCDVPPGVEVTISPDGYVITPQKVASPMQECFAPVTTVAIVAVPA